MNQDAASPPLSGPIRLNPFLFPSETVIRFILLNVALLGVTLYAYLQIGVVVFRGSWEPTQLACLHKLQPLAPNSSDPLARLQQAELYAKEWQECTRPVVFAQGLWMLAGVAFVLGLAFILYWIFPRRILLRQRLVPLSEEDAPEIAAELHALVRQAGLPYQPRFVWNPLDTSVSGQAFGRRGSYAVALTGGLASKYYTDLPAFRAVVLHELAHLHNEDIDISYFTIAVWQAFVFLCLLPLGLALLATGLSDLLFKSLLVLYTIPLVLLVFLTRNGVLRIREYYADLRVTAWEGPSGAIDRVLSAMSPAPGSFWKRIASFHPDPAHRRQTLADPGPLFKMSFREAFSVGLATSVAIPNLVSLFNNLLDTRPDLTNTLPALFFAPLAMGITGLGAYRISFAQLVRERRPARLFHLASGLALGIMLGFIISFGGAISQYGDIESSRSPVSLGFFITGFLLTTLVAYLLLRWIAACAESWLEVADSKVALQWVSSLSIMIAVGLFTCWMMLISYPVGFGSDAGIFFPVVLSTLPLLGPLGLFTFFDLTLQYGLDILILILLQCLWLLPLAAWLFQKRGGTGSDFTWAMLAPVDSALPRWKPGPLRPPTAVLIGIAGGLGLIALFFIIRLGLRLTVAEAVRDSDNFKIYYAISQMLLSGLVQAALGGITALIVPRQGVAHGLLTIFIAGVFGVAGFLLMTILFGGSLSFDFVWNVSSISLPWGFFFGLPAVILAASLRKLRWA